MSQKHLYNVAQLAKEKVRWLFGLKQALQENKLFHYLWLPQGLERGFNQGTKKNVVLFQISANKQVSVLLLLASLSTKPMRLRPKIVIKLSDLLIRAILTKWEKKACLWIERLPLVLLLLVFNVRDTRLCLSTRQHYFNKKKIIIIKSIVRMDEVN